MAHTTSDPPVDPSTALVDVVFGNPVSGATSIAVPSEFADLFAAAHRRVLGRPCGIHNGDGVILDPGTALPVSVEAAPERWIGPTDEIVAALVAAKAPVVLAGPGVVREGGVAGLHAFAVAGDLGVLNTWGAKGLFDWRSRHHLATVGLQALDFELGGLADADLVVAVGVDEAEAIADWRLAPVLELPVGMLGPLAECWSRPRTAAVVPELRRRLAEVTQAGWAASTAPLPPTRVTRHYGEVFGAGGLVLADPGIAGFWVARTFATTRLGGAQVPAEPDAAGFAIAGAIVSKLAHPARPVLAVVDCLDDRANALVEVGRTLGVSIGVEVWTADGPALPASAHRARLDTLATSGGEVEIRVGTAQFDEIVEAAGAVVAWTR